MTAPTPVAKRQAALRERRAALGLVRLELWVRPADVKRIRRYAEKVGAEPLCLTPKPDRT